MRLSGEYFTALSSRFHSALVIAALSALQPDARRRFHVELDRESARRDLLLKVRDHVRRERRDVERLQVVRLPAAFHACEVEERFDETVQAFGVAAERFVERLAPLGRHLVILLE